MLGGRERRHRAGSATAAMALGSYYRIVMMVSFGNRADMGDCASLACLPPFTWLAESGKGRDDRFWLATPQHFYQTDFVVVSCHRIKCARMRLLENGHDAIVTYTSATRTSILRDSKLIPNDECTDTASRQQRCHRNVSLGDRIPLLARAAGRRD